MKKFLKLSALLFAVMSVLFLGCSSGGGGGGGEETEEDVPVTSISILINNYTETSPYTLFEGDSVKLSAQVLPGTATDKGYSLEVTVGKDTVVTLNDDGTLTAVSDGQATVKITSTGKKADGEFATSSFNFVVTSDPEQITVVRLLVHNQNDPTDSATTTIATLNNDNRYVIVNNEANASVPSTRTNVLGNTILYINKPLKIQKNEDDSYTPYSISARVRLTGARTTGTQPVTGGNFGVTMGMFTNPKIAVTADTPLRFVGVRSAQSGQKRMYITRDGSNNDNSSASFASTNAWVDQEESNAAKTQGFKEQEYIFKVERTTNSSYTLKMFSADGLTELASNTRSSTNTLADKLAAEDEYLYLGFIISSVTAEISDIIVKDGETELFKSPAANPYPQPVLKVTIPTSKVDPGDGYDYQCLKSAFPGTGVQLTATTLPVDAVDSTITWSISTAGAGASVSSTGLVTATGSGPFTVKASAGEAFAEFKFNIYETIPPVTKITVSGPGSVMAGNGTANTGASIEMLASVEPIIAEETAAITWSVKAEDGTTATTAATINASTGALKATDTDIAADTVVKVFASSSKGAGGATVTSEGYAVTIRKYSSELAYELKTKTIGAVPNNGIHSNSYDSEKAQLTINGDGVIDGNNLNLNFVYVVLPNEDFVATVNLESFAGAASNNSKAGLFTFFDNPAGGLGGGGSPQPTWYLHVGVNNTAGEVTEMRKDSTGTAGRSSAMGTTTTTFPKTFRITYTKTDNTFVVAYLNGSTWVNGTNRTSFTVGDNIYLGLGVSSNNISTHGVGVFSDFVINGTPVDLSQTITAP
jgi:hypothetical protein